MHWQTITVLALLVLAGCQDEPEFQIVETSFATGADTFACRMAIPTRTSSNAPLIVAWHGIGDSAESMAAYSQLDHFAAKQGAIVVYPDAAGKLWQVPRKEVPDAADDRDLQRFDTIVDNISRQYNIDDSRIYVIGMSHGATFAQWLAAKRSTTITAVVAQSGPPPSTMPGNELNVPVLLIAGQDDPAHDAIRQAHQRYQAAGVPTQFISVPNIGHAWATSQNDAIAKFLSHASR
ncbi:CE1 family esterase [Bremerella sp. T1]